MNPSKIKNKIMSGILLCPAPLFGGLATAENRLVKLREDAVAL